MNYSSGCGRINLQITKRQAAACVHPGPCDAEVVALSKVPSIARQLAKVPASILRAELAGYGAWDDVELADHALNLQRLLWVACCGIAEDSSVHLG